MLNTLNLTITVVDLTQLTNIIGSRPCEPVAS